MSAYASKIVKAAKNSLISYRELKKTELGEPDFVVFAADEESYRELVYLIAGSLCNHIEFVSLDFELNNELFERVEKADIVLIYSRNPLNEIDKIAGAVELASNLNYRYLVFLSGNGSEEAKKILDSALNVNTYKIIASKSKSELVSKLASGILAIAPDEVLPFVLDYNIFDDVRRNKSLSKAVWFAIKGLLLIYFFGPLGFESGIRLISVSKNLFLKAGLKEQFSEKFDMMFAGALLLLLLFVEMQKKEKKRKKGIKARSFFFPMVIVFVLTRLLSGRNQEM